MIDKNKQALERKFIMDECVALTNDHKHIVIELPTGTGKGQIVANCIRKNESTKPWVVLVPEIAQIKNYIDDLFKHGDNDLLEKKIAKIICYASIDGIEGGEYNVHINECHRVSEHRMDILKTVKFDHIISDSATIDDKIAKRLNEIEPFYRYSMTLQEVINLGILPQPTVICIGVDLNAVDKTELYRKKMVTEKEMYWGLTNTVDFWKDKYEVDAQDWQRVKWLAAGSARKRWLSGLKTEKAYELMLVCTTQKERYVCYCGSVAQAKELGAFQAIHAGNKRSKQVIEDFNNGLTNSLFSCQMVVEGMNFTNVDRGIIIQLDGMDRTFLQKLGRILRGEDPVIYIIYVKGTRDETYLKTALSNIDKNYIKYI